MKKRMLVSLLCIVVAATLVVAGCGGGGGEQKAETMFINVATGGTAGTYFPLGGAMADIWNKGIEGANATAQSTGASVANVNMMKEGKVEVIFVQNDVAFYASTGTELFKEKYEDIRGMITMYPETIQIITLEDKGINTVADLKGKKIAVGAAGSGTEANARQILEASDITYEDIDEQYLSFAEAASNLKDGNIDAAFITAGHPTAAVQDIGAQNKIKLVAVDDSMADKLIAKYPFYTKITVPANTYTNVPEVKTVAVQAMLAVSSKMDENTVYAMVKALYDGQDKLKAAHTKGGNIKPETGLDGMSVTLHPGAEKFFKEKGISK